ncbi:MAG TPA: quinone-dependent dihydroorotate dehydrogenase [Chitinophagales bacterium]|jgi:dihydroorotate dehydrogenase|nr:quinone-dependent dihydroorotate dehydrogenase [Chitinophagales bacterium]
MYKILRFFLFKFDAETAHHLTLNLFSFLIKIPFVKSILQYFYAVENKKLERTVFGLTFKNPIGLAAGLDKNAACIDAFAALGFGFIEIGTVTPLPQDGNDKPRLFRLIQDEAIINRMGFNNAGMNVVKKNILKSEIINHKSEIIIGGNIGKNKVTDNELAIEDYIKCFLELYDVVDYFVVNVSSPNTPNLRALQEKEPLKKILFQLQEINQKQPKQKPILLKIAPDLSNEQLDDIIEIIFDTKLAGIVATNTTISRENLSSENNTIKSIGAGGLSGKPLTQKSTEIIQYIVRKSQQQIPIIAVGGIMSAQDAIDKLNAGASLVQLYTGFIYNGPDLIKAINKKLCEQ